jgi:hypothetical protein
MRGMLEQHGMAVAFERRRHASQSLYWFLRCIHGLPNENFPPVRLTWKLINVHHNRRIKLLEYIETIASLVIGKDLIFYGTRAEPGSGLPNNAALAGLVPEPAPG